MLLDPTHSIGHFSDLEIRRAIAHHRRAISALHDGRSYVGINSSTSHRIITRLEQDLRELQEELGRRRMQRSEHDAPDVVLSGAVANDSDSQAIVGANSRFDAPAG